MIKRFACVTAVVAFGLSLFALAQADKAKATGTKIGTININRRSTPLTKDGAISKRSTRNLNPSKTN